jgi:hypothetical protein
VELLSDICVKGLWKTAKDLSDKTRTGHFRIEVQGVAATP